MSADKTKYTISDDGLVVFEDGFSYRRAPRSGAPEGQTYIDPIEYRRLVTGEGLPRATEAELAAARNRPPVQLG